MIYFTKKATCDHRNHLAGQRSNYRSSPDDSWEFHTADSHNRLPVENGILAALPFDREQHISQCLAEISHLICWKQNHTNYTLSHKFSMPFNCLTPTY